ncbi:MAG: pilus assembly protein PilM [Candidatus Omnitrophica bacterium]|nr:pilus assembly protein PilM [Candidatus Omnitrophota bacterium]
MFYKPRAAKRVCASVDIGSHSIKVLESLIEHNAQTITKYAVKELSSEKDLPEKLKNAIDDAKLDSKTVRIALSGPNVIVRFITMPRMKPEELMGALEYEADRHIPYAVDEVSLDARAIGPTKENPDMMRVLFAAAKKDIVHERVKLLSDLGLTVSLIDVDAFCVVNAFIANEGDQAAAGVCAFLNVGYKYTTMIIVKGGTPYFTRDIQLGGREIKDSASEAPLEKLMEEIRLSLGYYENQYGNPLEKIYISGGLARLESLVAGIEKTIGIKPVMWSPIAAFNVDAALDRAKLEDMSSSLAVACGLLARKDI